MTRPANPNGCYDHKPLKKDLLVQKGWLHVKTLSVDPVKFIRAPLMVAIPDVMSKDCRYSVDYGNDPRCAGCIHNQFKFEGDENNE